MTVFLRDPDVTILHGDVLEQLATLPDGSVDCCVTSPPYWGLRDYGTGLWDGGDSDCDHLGEPLASAKSGLAGYTSDDVKIRTFTMPQGQICGKCGATRVDHQLGLEATPDLYVAAMVAVFREVRRVLKDCGTLWLNLGDSYAASRSYQVRDNKHTEVGNDMASIVPPGLKPKDLVGIPWRVAFALQADGWYLRSDIIWAKPNPMLESVTDRPTKAHEYVFLLSKSPRYFFDQEAVRESFEARPQQRLTANVDMPLGPARVAAGVQQGNPQGGAHVSRFAMVNGCGCHEAGCGRSFDSADCGCACHVYESPRGPDGRRKTHVEAGDGSIQHRDGERWPHGGRNVRSVWDIATQPYPEAHFATYPEELVRRCILAGTSERGVCTVCGKPWERETNVSYEKSPVHGAGSVVGRHYETGANNFDGAGMPRLNKVTETIGWRPTCDCPCPDCGLPYVHDDYMRELPEGVPAPATSTALLLEDLREPGQREETAEADADEQGIRGAVPTGASVSVEAGICDGAPSSDGAASRAHALGERSGASPERREGRQPAREPGSDAQEDSRPQAKEGSSVAPMPSLREADRGAESQVRRCRCDSGPSAEPSVVLDPFLGSGTTAHVARKHGRRCIGIELNADYCKLAAKRLAQQSLLTELAS